MRRKFFILVFLFTTIAIEESAIDYIIEHQPQKAEVIERPAPKSHKEFLHDIGHRESGNRYDIVSDNGYMGKYQFGIKTLQALGFNVTEEEFLNDPSIQEKAMLRNLKLNRKILKRYIDEYNGQVVDSIYITESGILAAAHLSGGGSVIKFFETRRDKKDLHGTKVTDYLNDFSGYELKLN